MSNIFEIYIGSTLVQLAMSKALFFAAANTGHLNLLLPDSYAQLDKELQTLTNEAHAVLSQLSEDCLVLANGKPDLYRRAGVKQFTSYLALLNGDFDEACKLVDQAAKDMENSLPETGAKGQLSQILNDVAKMYDAKAAAVRLRSIALSENDFEQMYADNAKRDISNASNNPYSLLGVVMLRLNQHRALAKQLAQSTITAPPVYAVPTGPAVFQQRSLGMPAGGTANVTAESTLTL